MKKILLNHGKVALVDNKIHETANQFNWYLIKGIHTFYAETQVGSYTNKNIKKIKMHRYVYELVNNVKLNSCQHIDHIDGNGLNNTITNLRIATKSQNGRNATCKSNITGFRGVYIRKNKYGAHIRFNGKNLHLGYFKTAEQAANAYDNKYREVEGNELQCNFKSPLGWCFITI